MGSLLLSGASHGKESLQTLSGNRQDLVKKSFQIKEEIAGSNELAVMILTHRDLQLDSMLT